MVIGIVTLSFNQASFLPEAIGSVVLSPANLLEYVIVDPGSKDESRKIITQLGSRFCEAVLEPDAGPADGLNKGFSRLKQAQVCGYLNADDRFTTGALDFVCQYFEQNPSIDILFGGIFIIDAKGRRKIRARRAQPVSLRGYAEGTCGFWQQGTFFRMSSFNRTSGFNPENRTCWDAELVLDMMLAGARVGYTRRILGEFRIHPASISGSGSNEVAYRLDQERLAQKIYSAGFQQRPAVIQNAARIKHRFSPLKQAANLIVGLSGVLRQSANTQAHQSKNERRTASY